MKILSWNLGAAWGRWRDNAPLHERAWHWIAAVDPDVAFLQEVIPPAWAVDRWTVITMPYTYWASALIAKRTTGLVALPLDPGSLLGRFGSYLATGRLELADGRRLLVASVHTRAAEAPDWVTDGHDRAAMSRSSVGVPWSNDVVFAGYRALTTGTPFIVGGDWNTARWADDAGVWDTEGGEFFSRAANAGWVEMSLTAEGTEGRTWFGPSGPRPSQIDHVFADAGTAETRRAMSIESYPAESLGLSDHAPIILELDLSVASTVEDPSRDRPVKVHS